MYKLKYVLLTTILIAFNVIPSELPYKVTISASQYDINNYTKWLSNRHCSEITNYQHPLANRATIESLLLCKALYYGGLNADIRFIALPNYARGLREAQQGNITFTADTTWLTNISSQDTYISMPIFDKHTFQKAFYTLPLLKNTIEEALKLNPKSPLKVIKKYTVVSSTLWDFDWQALQQLKIKTIDTTRTESMCAMIKYQRADLYLGEIVMNGNKDLSLNCNGTKLVPIHGIKVILNQSRHFAISKKYPNSDIIFNALQKGLKKLKDSGEIDKMMFPYDENKKMVNHWLNLLSPQQKARPI